ncbi:unnamed protein product, partial [Meganyctiphanes norvegica]
MYTDSTFDRCTTTIWPTGHISRSSFNGHLGIEDGGCYRFTGSAGTRVYCVCTTRDLCNSRTLCEQCEFPFSTLPTTTTTTVTTTSPEEPTTPVTTTSSEEPTTSTTEPLSCYSCYDCPQVDANTQVVQGSDVDLCVTTIF